MENVMKKLLIAITLLSVTGINAAVKRTATHKNVGASKIELPPPPLPELPPKFRGGYMPEPAPQKAKLATAQPGYFLINVPQSTGALSPQYYRTYIYHAIVGGFVNDEGGYNKRLAQSASEYLTQQIIPVSSYQAMKGHPTNLTQKIIPVSTQQISGGHNTVNLGISKDAPSMVITIVQTALDRDANIVGQKSMGTFQIVGPKLEEGGPVRAPKLTLPLVKYDGKKVTFRNQVYKVQINPEASNPHKKPTASYSLQPGQAVVLGPLATSDEKNLTYEVNTGSVQLVKFKGMSVEWVVALMSDYTPAKNTVRMSQSDSLVQQITIKRK
jgi:hypothetical protein